MKKTIFSSFICLGALYANVGSMEYKSIYFDRYGIKGFANVHRIDMALDNSTYIVQYQGSYRSPAADHYGDITYNKYADNFRIFVPNFIKSFSFKSTESNSRGWYDVVVGMDKPANTSTADPATIFNNAAYFNNDFNNKFMSMVSGKTLKFSATPEINLFIENLSSENSSKFNKWLYFTTYNGSTCSSIYRGGRDLLPGESAGTTVTSVTNGDCVSNTAYNMVMSIKIVLDKNLVDKFVADNKLSHNATLFNYCNNAGNYGRYGDSDVYTEDMKNKLLNACLYIKSFGDDGLDTDYTTNTNTVTKAVWSNNYSQSSVSSLSSSSVAVSSSSSLSSSGTKWFLMGAGDKAMDINTSEYDAVWRYDDNGTWINGKDSTKMMVPTYSGFWIKSSKKPVFDSSSSSSSSALLPSVSSSSTSSSSSSSSLSSSSSSTKD